MAYRDRILKVIEDSEVGLTTVDVAKKAGVSKTTVIKYLSVLRSEGLVQFVEVGPSKLWRTLGGSHPETTSSEDLLADGGGVLSGILTLPVVDVDICGAEGCESVYFSFKMSPDQICSIMKRARKGTCPP